MKHTFTDALRSFPRREELLGLVLLFILLTAAIASFSSVISGANWASLWESLLVGLLLGWFLGFIRYPAWRSILVILFAGLLFILLFAGGIDQKILQVLDHLVKAIGEFVSTLHVQTDQLNMLGETTRQVFTSTGVVVGRVITWLGALAGGKSTYDPVASGIVWSVLVWLVAAWAGWFIESKRNAFVAILPALLLNLITLSYSRKPSSISYIILGLTLVLVAVVRYNQHEQEWKEAKIAYPNRKGWQIGTTALLLAIVLVLLSSFISSLSILNISNWATELRGSSNRPGNGLAKSLGIATAPASTPGAFNLVSSPGLPRDFLIGASPQLLSDQVMSVEVKDLAALEQSALLPPLYWRSFTYDIYTGHGWSTSATQQVSYQANKPIRSTQLPSHILIQEVFRPVQAGDHSIYAAGEPVSVNTSSSVAYRSSEDLFGLQANSRGYTIQSLVPIVDENALRTAGQDYPAWITQRYLALPSGIPDRVKQLAIQLTASEPTPYDRAHALELFLRTLPYTLDIPQPPANRDLVDYFLFDLRKGYCDYYASAMVVLARSAGIPARVATGYATGTYNPKTKLFMVTMAEAHSWVEVYFPNIGWVPFEPTASRPAIQRSSQLEPTVSSTPPAPFPSNTGSLANPGRIVGFSLLVLVVLVGTALAGYDEIHLKRLQSPAAAHEVYRRMNGYGLLLKMSSEAGRTPYEFGASLAKQVQVISRDSDDLTNKATSEIQEIMRLIVRLSYRPAETRSMTATGVISQWKNLRWHLRMVWLLSMWKSIRDLLHRIFAPDRRNYLQI